MQDRGRKRLLFFLLGLVGVVWSLDNLSSVARFAVLTQPRSGSTWFVKYSEAFAKCSGVVTSGEIMHPAVVSKWSERVLGKRVEKSFEHADYLKYIGSVYESLASGEGWRGEFEEHSTTEDAKILPRVRAVGFKLMYAQLPRTGPGAPVADAGAMRDVTLKGFLKYAATHGVVIIHLTRLNHLERLISLEAIRNSNLTYHIKGQPTRYSHRDNNFKERRLSGIFLNVTKAHAFVRSQLKQNQDLQFFLDRYCEKFGASCETVAYEHLIGKNSTFYFDALRRAVGLDNCEISLKKDQKTTWVPCAQRIANFDELAKSHQFNRSAWLHMCQHENTIPQWLEDKNTAKDDAGLLRIHIETYEHGLKTHNKTNDLYLGTEDLLALLTSSTTEEIDSNPGHHRTTTRLRKKHKNNRKHHIILPRAANDVGRRRSTRAPQNKERQKHH